MKLNLVGCIILLVLVMSWTAPLDAKTLVLEGGMESTISLTQQIRFTVDKPLTSHSFRFALPTSFVNKSISQETQDLSIRYSPEPVRVEDEVDRFGNHYRKAFWKDLSTDVQITIQFLTKIRVALQAMNSKTPFPLPDVAEAEKVFLQASNDVQSKDSEIRAIARNLTAGCSTEFEAVTAILTHVTNTIRYAYNPPKYDAVYTLKSGSGNCQNLAQYSLALLRAAGIPARVVGGITLSNPWQVTLENGQSWVQRMGEGAHAWIEIYFPDLGWLSYDPLYSRQFTPTRHVKQTHGLEVMDVNDYWLSEPNQPSYRETVSAKFQDDRVTVKLASFFPEPRLYILSNRIVAKAAEASPTLPPAGALEPPTKPLPAPLPKPEPPVATPPKLTPKGTIEFGNMEFPTLVDSYHLVGNEGRKILDTETSEYVTSKQVFAQAFIVPSPMKLERISLAMRKFGGDGTIYVDVVADDNGKPGMEGFRSTLVLVDSITRKPGYYWVDFAFPDDMNRSLKQGKYWIVPRHSGDVIVNWFYTPGKPYSSGEDTRSTAKGYKWEDILNFDFVFKVAGVVIK